uniref:Uncharacterized protein n=1 Tax=Anguilla anguilla TaxID=7936 RepID=A0A0E9RDP4_ANGAN
MFISTLQLVNFVMCNSKLITHFLCSLLVLA